MRAQWIWMAAAAVAFGIGLPASAAAQTSTTTTTTVTQTTEDEESPTENHWLASGFVGSNFGADTNASSVDWGGSLGYLWNNALGAEFLASFAPSFRMNQNVLLRNNPDVNSYMLNAIGAAPLGPEGQWQPYVSGGLGAISLRAGTNTSVVNGISNTFNPDATKFGGDIGAGVMGFAGNVGFRADVRYFRAFSSSTNITTPSNALASDILSGLAFWRANVGVAVRW